MCFAPQRCALVRHRNCQKWFGPGVLYILTSKCASCHNGVHFFDISTSKGVPELVRFVHFEFEMCFNATTVCNFSYLVWPAGRFSEPTFRPAGATIHWKNSVSRLSYFFAHLDLLSSGSFSSTLLSCNSQQQGLLGFNL